MNKNKLVAGFAGVGLGVSSLAGGNAYAEGEMIDARINTKEATCALGYFATNFSIDELNSNAGNQSKAPSLDQTNKPNVAVIETPVELINYTDNPAKFILKSITKSEENGRYVSKDVEWVNDGDLEETSVYTTTPITSDGTYRIKVSAKGLGPINSTEKIPVSEICE